MKKEHEPACGNCRWDPERLRELEEKYREPPQREPRVGDIKIIDGVEHEFTEEGKWIG